MEEGEGVRGQGEQLFILEGEHLVGGEGEQFVSGEEFLRLLFGE